MKNNKAENLREKLKQALTSTARVISDDIYLKTIDERNKKDSNFVDIENLNSKGDFIKARALMKSPFELRFSISTKFKSFLFFSSIFLRWISSEITLAVEAKACLSFSLKFSALLFFI